MKKVTLSNYDYQCRVREIMGLKPLHTDKEKKGMDLSKSLSIETQKRKNLEQQVNSLKHENLRLRKELDKALKELEKRK